MTQKSVIIVLMNFPILFVLGLSGVGKSSLGRYVSEDLNFLHIEQDIPSRDGIEALGLGVEMKKYFHNYDPSSLILSLHHLASSKNKIGTIITFDSFVALTSRQLEATRQFGIVVILLDGSDDDCMRSFISREKELKTRRGQKRWLDYNLKSSAKFHNHLYDEYRVAAFKNHKHTSRKSLVENVKSKIQ